MVFWALLILESMARGRGDMPKKFSVFAKINWIVNLAKYFANEAHLDMNNANSFFGTTKQLFAAFEIIRFCQCTLFYFC